MGAAGELKAKGNAYMLNVSTATGSGSFPDSHLSAQRTSRRTLSRRGIPNASQSSESSGSDDEADSDPAGDPPASSFNSTSEPNSRSVTATFQDYPSTVAGHRERGEVPRASLASIEEGSDDEIRVRPQLPRPIDKSKRSIKRPSAYSTSDRRYVSSSFSSRNRPSNLQQQLGSLPNSSLQSLISSLTNSSGSSGNSTVTQTSYDKLAVRRRRPAKRRRAPRDMDSDKRASPLPKEKPEGSSAATHPKKSSATPDSTMEDRGQVRANMSRPASSTSRSSRRDSILSPPTPSSRRPSISSSRSSSRNELITKWKRQETFNSDSGISVTSSPEVRIPEKIAEDGPALHEESAFDSSDEESSEDYDPAKEVVPLLRVPSVSVTSPLPPSHALPDTDPLVQRMHDQEAAMQHHILHSPQPKRTIRPQVSVSYHPSPALPLYDRNASSVVPSTHPYSPPPPSSVPHGDPRYFQSFYDGHDNHLRPPEHYLQLDPQRSTIAGYEMLAKELAQAPDIGPATVKPLYRKFEQMNHRVLLHLQDELSELEEELRKLDEITAQMSLLPDDTTHPASRRTEARYGSDIHFQRTQVLGKIFLKLQQYNQGLASYSDAKNKYEPALEQDITAYQAWMSKHAPIDSTESRFLNHKDDLVHPGKRPLPRTEPKMETETETKSAADTPDLKHLMTLHCIMMVLLLLAFSIVPGVLSKFLFGAVLTCCLGAAIWLVQDKSNIAKSTSAKGA